MSKKHMHVFTCPECGCHDVATIEWHEVTATYYDFLGGLGASLYGTTNGTDILVSARCNECSYELTDDELAAIERSIAGLVIGTRPYPKIKEA